MKIIESYSEKLKIANKYLYEICGLGWNDFADINSLHDCSTEEDIKEYCDDRLSEAMYPYD